MADVGSHLPDDVLVKILLLIPALDRRRFRHVCKEWRDLIDERTPKLKYRAQILVFIGPTAAAWRNRWGRSSRALTFDGKDGHRKNEWTFPSCSENGHVYMVSTCNGLLCLHDSRSFEGFSFSTITVTNPVTGESLELPPAPTPWDWNQMRSPGKYSFGYHPVTGKHKVVLIPCWHDRASAKAVQVFTLGDDKMWREVRVLVPGASCNLSSEPLTVDGSTYWLTASSDRVMALDLGDEHVTSFNMPSVMLPARPIPTVAKWKLVAIHGSLGVIDTADFINNEPSMTRVWVMEGGGAQPRWICQRYKLTETTTPRSWSSWITAPQFAYYDYILKASRTRVVTHTHFRDYRLRQLIQLFRHKVGNSTDSNDEAREQQQTEETELIMSEDDRIFEELTTFAYVQTLEAVPRHKDQARRWRKF